MISLSPNNTHKKKHPLTKVGVFSYSLFFIFKGCSDFSIQLHRAVEILGAATCSSAAGTGTGAGTTATAAVAAIASAGAIVVHPTQSAAFVKKTFAAAAEETLACIPTAAFAAAETAAAKITAAFAATEAAAARGRGVVLCANRSGARFSVITHGIPKAPIEHIAGGAETTCIASSYPADRGKEKIKDVIDKSKNKKQEIKNRKKHGEDCECDENGGDALT